MDQPHLQLATMSRWYVVSRGIQAIAQLGIANHMSSQPVEVAKIAQSTGTNEQLLDRLLAFLSAYGVFKQEGQAYALTALSHPLRDDDPYSIRDVLCMADECWWQAFSQLNNSLKTGKSAFYLQHGDGFFNFLSNHPEKQANFDKGMAKLSEYDDDAIATSYPFQSLNSVVDLGGGRGGLVKALAKHYPQLPLTLFDTSSVITLLKQKDFPSHITLMAGDFLKTIPAADAYLFKGVLHDFDDETMKAILINCRKHLPKGGTLLIAEQVLPEQQDPHPNKTMDIVMMVLLGGRQRRLEEWKTIVESCGFTFEQIYPTKSLFTVMAFK